MFEIKLNEYETISLDERTIMSCMFISNSNCMIINDDINDDLSLQIFKLPLELISVENKTDYINKGVIRSMILYGLKEKIEKELSSLS